MQQSIEIPQEDFIEPEDTDESIEHGNTPPTEEEMEEVALRAIGRMTLQELINDSISALVEVYTARPESFQYDADHYDDEDASTPNPFLDLIKYLQDVRNDEHSRDSSS